MLIVSFEAQRDTPAELKKFKRQHHIEDWRWIVARASASGVRLLAAVPGIRYRELPDHSSNHSAVIVLANQEGVVRSRAVGVQGIDDSFLATLRTLNE